ncbi:MAG: PKD domain-containing protein [Rhodocyclaceae bacterium]|nr:PKD domain-containing protein [Rhodocyclaceae bacterium]
MIRMPLTWLAALLALLLSCLSHAALPGLTTPWPADGSVSLAAGDQTAPSIAAGNGVRLVLWTDQRANPYVYNEYETSGDIYGVRLADDGTPLDAVPFAIHAGRGAQGAPMAAWNGSEWLVLFRTLGLSGTGFFYQNGLAAVRVAADGSVVDADPIPLHGLGDGAFAVASDGVGWVVATIGNDISRDIFAVRISALGEILDPPTRSLVSEDVISGSGLRLAYAGGTYLLAFGAANGTGAVLFDAQLNSVSAPFLLVDGHVIATLASSGQGFYVAWNAQRADFTSTVMGARVGLNGVLIDAAGVDLAGANAPYGNVITAAWDGGAWRVAWEGLAARDLYLARIDGGTGQVMNPGGTVVAGAKPGPMAGTGTGAVQLVWSAFSNNEYDVLGATVGADGGAIALDGIGTALPRQYRTHIAAGASGFLMSYLEAVAGEFAVKVRALDAAGGALTLAELDRGPTLSGPGSPAVAWNGSHYLVSWGRDNGVWAMRVGANGVPIDAAPTQIMTGAFGEVDVAAVGDDFLVVGRHFGQTIQIILPIAVRVSGATGQALDAVPIELSAGAAGSPFTVYTRDVVVAPVDGRWLVAWQSNITHDESVASAIAAFVNPDGSKGDPFLIGPMVTNGGNFIHRIALGSSGGNALYAQSRELTSGVETDLELFLIQTDQTVVPLGNATPWSGNQYRPFISFDGRDYIVVFQDQKNRLAPFAIEALDARSDLYGMRVGVDGSILDPEGFLIDDRAEAETDPVVASRGSDTLIAASQLANDGIAANYRIAHSGVLDGTDRFPVALASASVRQGDAPLAVSFDAVGSFDPEGGPVSVRWDFADGGVSTLSNPSHTFAVPGEYPVLMTVTDATGRSASQAIMVQVLAPNIVPVAVASSPRLSGPAPLSVTLYADGSYDPDGPLGNIEWLVSDGRNSFGSPAFLTFNTEGEYTVTLRLRDSRGGIGEDTLTVTVGGANQPPVAVASATPTAGQAPLGVNLIGSGSSDVDGSIVSYAWDFGDGTSGSGANPFHTYASVGTFVATLTVTDNSGDQSSDSVSIVVDGHSARSLLTQITMSSGKQRGTPIVEGTVQVTNGVGEPLATAIVTGHWTLPDGSRVSRSQYADRRGNATFSTAQIGDGTYVLTIDNATYSGAIFDPQGSETEDSLVIGNGGVPDTTPPATPTGLVATAGDGSVSLDWADNGEADLAGYHVERSLDPAGPFTRLTSGSGVTPSQYVDTGLPNGVTIYYRVIAVDTSSNLSQATAVVSATPQSGGATATSLHVGGIVLGTANVGKGSKVGVATVTVLDDLGRPVSGALVGGSFSGSYVEGVIGTTGANGTVELRTSSSQKGGVSFGFCVTSVQHASLPHEVADDAATCGQF